MVGDPQWDSLCHEFAVADREVRAAWAAIEARLGQLDLGRADASAVKEQELMALAQAKAKRDVVDARMTAYKRNYFVESGFGGLHEVEPPRAQPLQNSAWQ